jgi:hypothetical protein
MQLPVGFEENHTTVDGWDVGGVPKPLDPPSVVLVLARG